MCKSPLIGLPYLKREWKDGHFETIFKYRFSALEGNLTDYHFPPVVNPETGEVREMISVPCGQCNECRLAYSKVWADRCMMESVSWDQSTNWFVTLTYDPREDARIISDVSGLYTLVPDDLTKFMHDLRQKLALQGYQADGVRFFACGEYGDKNGRCHFHVLLFNVRIPDAELIGHNFQGDAFYRSNFLESIWKHGFVCLANFSWQTAAYTARYVMKKRKGKEGAFYSAAGIVPEFTRMSRRPGIGAYFIERHLSDMASGQRLVCSGSDGRIISAGRYGDSALQRYDPVAYSRIKAEKKALMDSMAEARREASTLTDSEFFQLRGAKKDSVARMFAKFRSNLS